MFSLIIENNSCDGNSKPYVNSPLLTVKHISGSFTTVQTLLANSIFNSSDTVPVE